MSHNGAHHSNRALAAMLARAIQAHERLPEFPSTIELGDAYALQHMVTSLCTPGSTDGIKAGVTADRLQKHLGLKHALLGSLYGKSRLPAKSVLPYIEGRMLECELAVTVDGYGNPKAVAPAVEIVYLRFSRQDDFSASNLVSCNLGADTYIVGDSVPWSRRYGAASVTLTRDGEVLNRAPMNDALGGSEESIRWIWQESIHRGFAPVANSLLLTGACESIAPHCLTGRTSNTEDYLV